MKKVFIFLICWLYFGSQLVLFAQTVTPGNSAFADRTKILPPAPNAAAIAKYGGVDVLLNSGSVNKSVELKSVVDRALTIPIVLNYTSNGIQVNEYPSRVGMGWNIQAGGQISRVVKGKDDLLTERYTLPASTVPNDESQSVTTYCWKLINEGIRDAEPDIFTFSFGNYSGKFIFNDQGVIVGLPATNLQIIYNTLFNLDNSWAFKIITTDGVTYFFGGPTATESSKMGTSTSGNVFVPTSWHLKKIVHPNGYYTTLNYEQYITGYTVDKAETQYKLSPDAGSTITLGGTTVDGVISNYNESQSISVKTTILKEIITSAGAKTTFSYSGIGYPEQIINQIVSTNENGVQVGKYSLEYDLVQSGISIMPFLKKIKELSSSDVPLNNGFEFNYINLNNIPERFSNSQDHWGYFNNKTNSTLIPTPDELYLSILFPNATANRNPDPLYAGNGLLTKIIYPTGGQDEIQYEPNVVKELQDINGYNTISGNVTSHIDNTWAYSTPISFTVNYDNNIRLTGRTENIGPTQQIHSPAGKVIFKDVATNTVVQEISFTVQAEGSPFELYALTLPAGNYTMTVASNGVNIKTTANVTYRIGNSTPNMQYVDVPIGGMRVQKITTNALSGGAPQVKRLYYGTLSDLNFSSAAYVPKPTYFTPYEFTTGIYDVSNCAVVYRSYSHQAMNYRSLVRGNLYDGKLVKYYSVIESIGGDNFENGAVEHKFDIVADIPSIKIRGNKTEAELSNASYAEKGEIETTVYAKKNGNLVKLRNTQNEITIDSRRFSDMTFFSVFPAGSIPCANWSGSGNNAMLTGPFPLYHKLYHINKYILTSEWKYLSKKTEQSFDENGQNPSSIVSNYYYDNEQHLLLTRVETLNSKGDLLKSTYKYPNDFAAPGNEYTSMVSKNMINFLVEEKKYKNGSELEKTLYNYTSTLPNLFQTALSNIESQKTGFNQESRFRYYKYDVFGNPLEFSKENDVKQSIIWDYHSQFPVAQVNNASQSDIAYCSFEADGKGGWTFTGAGSFDPTAPAGRKSYNNNSGGIIKNGLNASAVYFVSYWTKNGTAFNISGTVSGYPIQGRSINNWHNFIHKITGQSQVSITQTALIDELRLYPENAVMSTMTYDPLIGVTSQADANNKIIYYQYDDFNRLKLIRDQDRNILKKICYNYTGQIENCTTTNFAPDWQNTDNPPRCQVDATGQYTGFQEQEQVNTNPASVDPPYNQTKWVTTGQNSDACPLPVYINLTSTNTNGSPGFTASYYNTATGYTYNFTISSSTSLQALGTVPAGNYTLTISKPGNSMGMIFKSGCNKQTSTGTSATFYNVAVSTSTCNSITISNNVVD